MSQENVEPEKIAASAGPACWAALDLAYRSCVRLKRLLELQAPGVFVKKEMCFLVERLMHKYDDPTGYMARCLEAAERRDEFNSRPTPDEIEIEK